MMLSCKTPYCPFRGTPRDMMRHKRTKCRDYNCGNVRYGCPMRYLTLPELKSHTCYHQPIFCKRCKKNINKVNFKNHECSPKF